VLLQKTLLNVEGLGRQLYPDLDLWSTAQPYLEQWMRKRIGPSGFLKTLQTHFPAWLEQSPEMPQLIHDALLQLRGAGPTEQQNRDTLALLKEQQLRGERRRGVIAALLVAAAVVASHPPSQQWLSDLTVWSWILFIAAGALVLRGSR
jgi:ubiquinone biosynthesis protein